MSGNETNLSPDLRAALQRVTRKAPVGPTRVTFDLLGADAQRITDLLGALVHAAGLTPEERVEALAAAFATEALRGRGDASTAHANLCVEDDDLARAIETLAPWLIARMEGRKDAEAAVVAVEDLLRDDPFD